MFMCFFLKYNFVIAIVIYNCKQSVDKYRKKLIHPLTSAKVAMTLLKGAPITESERDKIWEIIRHHDKPLGLYL